MLGREHAVGHPVLTDEETGLGNRLLFELVYSYLFQAADRGVPVTLLLLSAAVPARDTLRTLGERVQSATRSADLVAHLGSGRFIMVLLGANLSGGRVAADRIESAVQGAIAGPVCIGLAQFRPGMKESAELLKAVDAALRRAEAAGGGIEMEE